MDIAFAARPLRLAAGLLLCLQLSAQATTIDFETFPDSTPISDSTPITTQFPGLTFADTMVISAGISLNEFEFPPRSGSNVAFDDGGPISIVSASPLASFGAYFTYTEALTLTAFDSLGNSVGSATSEFSNNLACFDGPPCQGDPGSVPNEFIQLAFDHPFVEIIIQGDPGGSSFVMDDATFTTSAPTVPEPSTTALSLAGAALALVVICNRRFKNLTARP